MKNLPADLVPRAVAENMVEWRREAKPWHPHDYQGRSLKFVLENAFSGLLLDPGMGKTSITLAEIKVLLKKKLIKRALVVAPLRACYDVWPAEVCDWTDFKDLRVALLHGPSKDKVLRQLQPGHQICLINPEGVPWLTANRARMKALDADMLIIDECFAAGTLISTPHGKLPIESLHDGDIIINESGTHSIIGVTAHKPAGNVVEVRVNAKTIRCTEDHPFFTELGWLPAKCLEGRRLLGLATLRNLRQNNAPRSQTIEGKYWEDLLTILSTELVSAKKRSKWRYNAPSNTAALGQSLESNKTCNSKEACKSNDFGRSAYKSLWFRKESCNSALRNMWHYLQTTCIEITLWVRKNLLACMWHSLELETRRAEWQTASASCSQTRQTRYDWPCAMEYRNTMVRGGPRQNFKDTQSIGQNFFRPRREWKRAFTCGAVSFKLSSEELYLQLRSRIGWKAARLSNELQSRFWGPSKETSVGSGWSEPPTTRPRRPGQEERSEVEGARVECVSYLERGSVPLVYNLEVEGCPHFEIEDCALVHNSSLWKSSVTVRFRALRKWLHTFKRRHILTGSPRPRNYLDLHGQVYLLDRGAALGEYLTHYRGNYFFPTGFEMREWEILPGAAEKIDKLVAPMVLRLDAKDYLKLPRELEQTHRVELPPKARMEYDKIEASLMSTLFTAPLVSSASARSKCCQIANGSVYTDPVPEERWGKERPFTVVHTAKVDALVELVNELQGEPLLVAIGYHHDVVALRKALGKDTPCINGETTRAQAADYIERWNKGLIPVQLGHPASMAHALNMQKFNARHVAYFDIPDNYDLYHQFFLRVCRQGNKALFVMKHHFVCMNTVDVPKMRNLRNKETGQKAFLDAMKVYSEERRKKGSV
jgi:hypothetical protein